MGARWKERIKRSLDNQYERDDFVRSELRKLPDHSLILDAGAGSQRYRNDCKHLDYRTQDLGEYTRDQKQQLGDHGANERSDYEFGPLDYTGNIWQIGERNDTFDAILCTEVLEHVPYPIDTVRELARLLKPGGTLILTAPSNCLRHFDPIFFTSGFSDRWFEKVLPEVGLEVAFIQPVGDYYRWVAVELARTMKTHPLATPALLSAFAYYRSKKPTKTSIDTLCMGYHVVARKSMD